MAGRASKRCEDKQGEVQSCEVKEVRTQIPPIPPIKKDWISLVG